MSLTRSQAMLRIEGQRRAIREHIQKFENYPYSQDKEFALRTISICKKKKKKIKRQCNVYIESSWEDSWTAPYYALDMNELLSLREEIVEMIKEESIDVNDNTVSEEKVKVK